MRIPLLVCCVLAAVGPGWSQALLSINGSTLLGDNFHNKATWSADTAPSSWFNQTLIDAGDGPTISSGFLLNAVPYYLESGSDSNPHRYFEFVYDLSETSPAKEVQWSTIRIYTDTVSTFNASTAVLRWDLDDTLPGEPSTGDATFQLNATSPFTDTPLSRGGDVRLFIETSFFEGLDSNSTFFFLEVTQALSDNGADQWVYLGPERGGAFFSGIISDVPEPSTLLMFAGSGLLVLRRRRAGRIRRLPGPPAAGAARTT